MSDTISRADAVKTVIRKCSPICAWQVGTQQYPDCVVAEINTLPSDAVDCTDFINWLLEEVMEEEMWELNAVANGEIICRKLEKLGVLETTEEPSYYIRPSADAVQGEWIDREHCQVDEDAYEIATCSHCKAEITLEYPNDNFCPNCGARMNREDGEV